MTIKNEWNKISDEKQFEMLEKAARAACKKYPESLKRAAVSPVELVGEAWIIADERLEKDETAGGKELELFIFSCAVYALQKAARLNAHSIGGSDTTNDDGENVLDLAEAAAVAEYETGAERRPVERAVINRQAISAAAIDAIDERILSMLIDGFTWSDIQKRTGVSSGSLGRRVEKLRERIKSNLDEISESQSQKEKKGGRTA